MAQLLDCDTHLTDHEPRLWAELVPPAARPQVIEHDGAPRLRIGELLFPRPDGPGQGNPKGLGHLIGPGHTEDRGRFMTENGIAACVLQPGFVGLSVHAIEDAAARTELAAGYNRLAAQECAATTVDLRWSILLLAADLQWSLAEILRYAGDPHVVGASIRPTASSPAHRLHAEALRPVLDELAARELTLFLHGGTGCYQWSPLADSYADYTLTHALGHVGEHMIGLTDLLVRRDGLPDGLGVVLLESGIGWIPAHLSRLDSHIQRLDSGRGCPSDTFAAHVGVVPDPGERHAAWALAELGWRAALFGSDYPHWDAVRTPEWFGAFGEHCTEATLRGNTERLVPRLARPVAPAARQGYPPATAAGPA